jgi:hypothetical protein
MRWSSLFYEPQKSLPGAPVKIGITSIRTIAITKPNKRTSIPSDRLQEKSPAKAGLKFSSNIEPGLKT